MSFSLQSERRKRVRLRRRPDLETTLQRYEGHLFHVVKDPINLRYYRLDEQHYFVFTLLDGRHTLEDVQKEFEERFRPERLSLEDLESFARQLVTNGLVQHESPNAGQQLFEKLGRQRRMKRLAAITNILYIKIPIFDPDRLLTWMYRYLFWIFTNWFLFLSILFMLGAAGLVTMKFQIFWDRLPAYHEFFRFKTLLYLWISLGFVKVIHEFGHGLSCKAFGGECHQMGALFMCFSPSLYCNVSDAWTLANKWQRILISFAGIYVELMIAAAATFVWWYTPHWPFVNNVALCLMTLCSISTFVFNANPLMRFDGYYILADWLEVPNLREKSNRFLGHWLGAMCLGIEFPPEPRRMAWWRLWLFRSYAVLSWIYRWVVTFGILYFLMNWLKPYNLETLSYLLAFAALGSMIIWPLYRLASNIKQRGRLPDMKRKRVMITSIVLGVVVVAFFFAPLPINRVMETGLVQIREDAVVTVYVPDPGGFLMQQPVHDGDRVTTGKELAVFANRKLAGRVAQLEASSSALKQEHQELQATLAKLRNTSADAATLARAAQDLANVEGKMRAVDEQLVTEKQSQESLKSLKAPRDGIVMSAPKKDDMFKFWDKAESGPFCKIGDMTKLRLLVPVGATEYRRIKEDLDRKREEAPSEQPALDASILLGNRSDHIYRGRVTTLPDTHESNIPVGLTSRAGGPVAIRPSQNSGVNEPVAQTYIVQVEILDPDASILPGTQAKVKIHLHWRSAAWWVGQKLASALDWGLW
jgi:putative peptide zinc metalloprotease protein